MSQAITIIDPSTIVRQGLVHLINNKTDYHVISDYDNSYRLFERFESDDTDIVIAEYYLPDINGLDLIRSIKSKNSFTKALILSNISSDSELIKLYQSDYDGYVSKASGLNILVRALDSITRGVRYFDPSVLPRVNKVLLENDNHNNLISKLTKREKQILNCVASGMSNKEIAFECNISERTVKNHLSSIFLKIEVSDRTQAAVFAIRTGLTEL